MKPQLSSPSCHSGSIPPATGLSHARIIELLHKYDRSGPRYTSYPPASEFKTMSADVYLAALEQQATLHGDSEPVSLYIHIPFCSSPCFYCGCNKIITHNRNHVRQYLEHLRKEMALLRLQTSVYKRPVMQLHWGGGTPTFLDDAELTELVHLTSHYFNLQTNEQRDYSIEVDPRTVNRERIELLRGLGFNRISLGIQDFDERVQKAVNRVQRFDEVAALVEIIRARAFSSLNFDLIYGLPLQTVETIRETLQLVIALSPDRISYYNYAHLPERFSAQRAIYSQDLPTPAQRLEILTTIIDVLTGAGYLYIGIDHFVKKSDTLALALQQGKLQRNFQGYSIEKATDLIGLGVSSISQVGNVFAQNEVRLQPYYQALDANQLPVVKGLVSGSEDALRREIIRQLSCFRALDIASIERDYDIEFSEHFRQVLPELEQFERDGLVSWQDEKVLTVTPDGALLLRNLCMVFDEYLNKEAPIKTLFSRAI
ncbi:MAG: oxygen-independent coproporphyrinogen III oxidase [Pseudomonadota bacterium]